MSKFEIAPMDRVTVFAGQVPLETDILSTNQFAMIGLAKLAESVLGPSTQVSGFPLTPTGLSNLVANLGPGVIYQQATLEATQWSTLSADTTHVIEKQGILLDAVPLTFTPPATAGFSQCFLVEVQYSDVDAGSIVRPYYNSANPTTQFNGPGGGGASTNTVRKGAVSYTIKPGVAVSSGSQVPPNPDAGYAGLWVVTLASGATQVAAGNITPFTGAPFIPVTLPNVPLGVQSGQWEYAQDTGVVNASVVTMNPIPTALVVGMEILVKWAATNTTTTPVLNVNGLGNKPVVKSSGAVVLAGDLVIGNYIPLVYDGANWRINGLVISDFANNPYVRPRAQGNTIVYVATTGSDTLNNGLSAASPFLTIQRAWSYLTTLDFAGFTATIQIANGTYAGAGLLAQGGVTGTQGGFVFVIGNPASPASVVISNTQAAGLTGATGSAVGAISGAQLSLNGLTIQCSNYHGVVANGPGSVIALQNMIFGSCPSGNHVFSQLGAEIYTNIGSYQINGSAVSHFSTAQSGVIYNNGLTSIQTNGTLTFSSAFVSITYASSMQYAFCSITVSSGSVTGTRYSVGANAVLYTAGGGANYFPGSIAGSTGGNGYYG